MSEESVPQIIVSTDDMTAAVNKLDEDDPNELPDIIPAEKAPPDGTPIPKLKIENPQKPEDKKPPDMAKLNK